MTKTKELPEVFSHSDLLKKELEDIKKYKEDSLLNLLAKSNSAPIR